MDGVRERHLGGREVWEDLELPAVVDTLRDQHLPTLALRPTLCLRQLVPRHRPQEHPLLRAAPEPRGSVGVHQAVLQEAPLFVALLDAVDGAAITSNLSKSVDKFTSNGRLLVILPLGLRLARERERAVGVVGVPLGRLAPRALEDAREPNRQPLHGDERRDGVPQVGGRSVPDLGL